MKNIINTNLKDMWILYPWFKNSSLDNLIHPSDLTKINIAELGVVKCVKENDEFLSIQKNDLVLRVKKIGVKRILPKPFFVWGDNIKLIINKKFGIIIDVTWHHKDEVFYYFIEIEGRKYSKRLKNNELGKRI